MLRHLLSGLRPGSIPGGSTWTMNYESGFGRLSSITGGAFNQQYNYRTTSDGKKTNQITSISYSGITYPNSDDTRTYTYTYDANGNITSAQFGIRTVTYEYDSQNQLIKETNEKLGRDFTYTYDNAGNILTETTYVYPTTSTGSGSTSTVSFAYDSGWGDLLNSYGNGTVTRQVTHDEIGNRLSDANRTYTWRNGRELATVTKNGVTWTNTYNANGMRTKRTDGTNTYEYIYNGDKLMQMKKNGEVINFTYVGNMPATMTYQGNTFYYVVNAQGDVTGMTNSAGKLVVSYTYDAWGRWIYYIQDTEWSNVLGGINPLLYRGYVYDHETGLYYLQSRYYDYNTHRFLNADAFISTGQGFTGNNMFAYCLNSPVNRIDIGGMVSADFYSDDGELMSSKDLGEGGGGNFDAQQAILDGNFPGSVSSFLPQQGLVTGDSNAPPVDAGKQGKHVVGHNNYDPGKSSWPKGQTGVQQTQEAWQNGVKDYRKPNQNVRIGMASDGTIVRVHMGGNGAIHGYPFYPYSSENNSPRCSPHIF